MVAAQLRDRPFVGHNLLLIQDCVLLLDVARC